MEVESCGIAEGCKNAGTGVNWIECERCQVWFHFKCIGWRDVPKQFENYVFICRRCKADSNANDTKELLIEHLSKIRDEMISIKNDMTKSSEHSFASTSYNYSPNKSDKICSDKNINRCEQTVQDAYDCINPNSQYHEKVKKNKVFLELAISLPEFRGTLYEDPQLFLNECEKILSLNRFPQNEWGWWVRKKIKGGAKCWALLHSKINLPWNEFKTRFLDRFDHKSIVIRIKQEFYGRKQSSSDNAERFIIEKVLLHRRIYPKLSDNDAIPIIVESLLPFYKSCLFINVPKSIEDLLMNIITLQFILTQ